MSTKAFVVAAALSAALFLSGAWRASAAEDVHWNGAGWYGIADVIEWGWIVSGPFADEDSCKATLPADDDETKYYCEYLSERPDWD